MKSMNYQTIGTSALQNEYIEDIPWDKAPFLTSASSDSAKDIEIYRSLLEKAPPSGHKISFEDDVWDLSPYVKYIKIRATFNFSGLPKNLSNYCKFFVLYKLSSNTKISTIMRRYGSFLCVYSQIVKNNQDKNLYTITTEDLINEVERGNRNLSSVINMLIGIYQVYYFLTYYCKLNLPVDLEKLKAVKERYGKNFKQADTKLSNIPEEYFNLILNKSIEVMRNNNAHIDMRMTAAALVLLSQTGLRLSEFLGLTTDRLLTKKLKKSGVEVNYIHYMAFKQSKVGVPILEFDIYCSKIAAEAFSLMRELREKIDSDNKGNILFILSSPKNYKAPYPNDMFGFVYRRFMYTYLYRESTRKWEGIKSFKYYPTWRRNETPITLYIPDTRQFRVHLCSALYEGGVDLLYIRKYMGHLSGSMTGYYVRPKDTYQENIQYSEKVIQEIAGEDLTPLGGNHMGEKIKNNIKKFIEDNNFNVYTNISEIMKAFGETVVIRGKTGGVCIKTSRIPCANDKQTDRIMCAYNICPNLFHFFYMLDITYVDFKTLQEAYLVNKNSGYTKQSQKELAKIQDLINRRLIPELDELEKELERKGYDAIISKHPTLIDIIEKREEIRKEAEEWKQKKYSD